MLDQTVQYGQPVKGNEPPDPRSWWSKLQDANWVEWTCPVVQIATTIFLALIWGREWFWVALVPAMIAGAVIGTLLNVALWFVISLPLFPMLNRLRESELRKTDDLK